LYPYAQSILIEMCNNTRWFAEVQEGKFDLQTITLVDVDRICGERPCILFHGEGEFRSKFRPCTAKRISFPVFDSITNN
jgi:hypothetical protein